MSARHDGRGNREEAEHRLRERAAARLAAALVVLREQLGYRLADVDEVVLALRTAGDDEARPLTDAARALLGLPGGAR